MKIILDPESLTQLGFYCDKDHGQKQLGEEEAYFSSQFHTTVHHGGSQSSLEGLTFLLLENHGTQPTRSRLTH